MAIDELKLHAPVLLSDGTPVSDLVDVDRRRISARVFVDPEIHQLELRKVFGRTWCFVGHTSEIPREHDFMLRHLAGDPVIVSRADDGEVHVSLNSCSHRGVPVCRTDGGNASLFKCSYHGWVYDSAGALRGVTAEQEMFGGQLDKSCRGLRQARVAVYEGFVFATWEESGPSFDEQLGSFRFYADLLFGLTDAGLEVVGPPQRWVLGANWKIGAENFQGDSYHTMTTHQSMVDAGFFPADVPRASLNSINVCDDEFGHGALFAHYGNYLGDDVWATAYPAMTPELVEQAKRRLSPAQLEIIQGGAPPHVGNLFPNFSFLNAPMTDESCTKLEPAQSVRTWNPRGPNEVEVVSWAVAPKDAPVAIKDKTRARFIRSFGASGFIDVDDTANWVGMQRALQNPTASGRYFEYLSTRPPDPENWLEPGRRWPGPGSVHQGTVTEDNLWAFWSRWRDLMVS